LRYIAVTLNKHLGAIFTAELRKGGAKNYREILQPAEFYQSESGRAAK